MAEPKVTQGERPWDSLPLPDDWPTSWPLAFPPGMGEPPTGRLGMIRQDVELAESEGWRVLTVCRVAERDEAVEKLTMIALALKNHGIEFEDVEVGVEQLVTEAYLDRKRVEAVRQNIRFLRSEAAAGRELADHSVDPADARKYRVRAEAYEWTAANLANAVSDDPCPPSAE